jgi:hypothetical protein
MQDWNDNDDDDYEEDEDEIGERKVNQDQQH